ncbi:MAG: ankyrin repeat domain-containing protein [Candidatus Omnitrophota bacterium]
MGKTIAEKILSLHAGKDLKAGDFAVCDLDFCFGQDGTSGIIVDRFKVRQVSRCLLVVCVLSWLACVCFAGELEDKLFETVEKSDVVAVADLLSRGVAVDARRKDGLTALMITCMGGYVDPKMFGRWHDTVEVLLKNGSNPNLRHPFGEDHYDPNLSQSSPGGGIVRDMISVDTRTILTRAIYRSGGRTSVVRLLLEYGADVNAKAMNGATALAEACSLGRNIYQRDSTTSRRESKLELVKMLLENGADVNDSNGLALFTAVRECHTEIVKLLLAKGADVHLRDLYDSSILRAAVSSNCPDVIRLLVENGADLNTKDRMGHTPLIEAALYGKAGVVKVLLEKGADVNTGDRMGRTALWLLVHDEDVPFRFKREEFYPGNVTILMDLLNKGADVNAKAEYDNGRTLLMYAADSGKVEFVRVMLDKGADASIVSNGGETALALAKRRIFQADRDIDRFMSIKYTDLNAADKNEGVSKSLAIKKKYQEIVELIELALAKQKSSTVLNKGTESKK